MKPPPASRFRIAAILLPAGILAARDWTGIAPGPLLFTAAALDWQPGHLLIPVSLLMLALPSRGAGLGASPPARLAAFALLIPLHSVFWTAAWTDPLHGPAPLLLLLAAGVRTAATAAGAPTSRSPERALSLAAALAGALLVRDPGALLLPCLVFPTALFAREVRHFSRPVQALLALALLNAILRQYPAPSLAPLLHALTPPLPEGSPAGILRTLAVLAPVGFLLLASLWRASRAIPAGLAIPAAAVIASFLAGDASPHGRTLAVFAIASLAAAGIESARQTPAVRPAVYAAVLLLAAAHGVRTRAGLGEMRILAREEAHLQAWLDQIPHPERQDPPATVWVLGAPEPPLGARPDSRVLARIPGAGGLPAPGRRLRIFQWGAARIPDRGRPERYRLEPAFEAEIAGPTEIELIHPPSCDRRDARHSGDEPVFRWSIPDGGEAEPFVFAWWGTDRDTGRLRFQSRPLGGDVLSLERSEGRCIYIWRPSIRPAGGEQTELIWEDGDFTAPGTPMHWTVARAHRDGGGLIAASPRSITVEGP